MNEAGEFRALRARVECLEMTCAFQERLVSKLDEVVRVFADRVDELEAQVRLLKSAKTEEPIGPQNDPPPHYQ